MLNRALWLLPLLLGVFAPIPSLGSTLRSESFLLPNGLRVITKQDPSSALVALQLSVETGTADEAPEELGLAHVLEHVLFRGSAEEGRTKLAGEVESLGGRINGFTSHDRTVYHMILPASETQNGLKILARLSRLPDLEEPQFQKEIQVVLEEWKQGQDNPNSRVSRELFQNAFRHHPYGRPVIGTPQSLKALTWATLSQFYRRWYTAQNMTVIAVGNFDSEAVKKESANLFSSLPTRGSPVRHRNTEPPQTEPRVAIVRAPARQSHLMIGFPMPDASHQAAPALDFLAFILGRGESSRLAQKVKISGGYVNSISASTFTPKDPGLFLIQAELEPEKTMDALRGVLKEVYRLGQEPVSSSELERARVNFIRTVIENKETVQGQANQLRRFQSLYGNPDYEATYLETIRQLEAEQLKTVAQTYFHSDHLTISLLVPEETPQLPDPQAITRLSRSLRNPSEALQAMRDNGVLKATFGNGLRILILEDRRLPLLTVHAGAIGGLALENQSNNGIHNFIAAMLTQGNPRLTSTQLIYEVEHLGGRLNGSAGNNTINLTGIFPSQNGERGLEIFLETLFHPIFPEAELEKKRREILNRIKNRDERSRAQAFRLFNQTLFRNHPYRFPPAGEREQVLGFRREELAAYYQRLVSPDRVVLTVVGDVDGERLLSYLHGKLSSLPKIPSSFSLPTAENQLDEKREEKKRTKLKQAHLVLGFPAPIRGQPDYFAMKVLEVVLSRIGGRLFLKIRDQEGLAYSVGAFALDDPLQGAFGIYAATDPMNIEKIKEGILRELRRLQDEEVADQELVRAKKYLIGNYLIARQTNLSKAGELTFNELFGFGGDFAERYREGIEKVSAGDVLRFAREYLSLDRYVLTILGP